MNFVTPLWLFNLLVISTIIIFLLATTIVLSKNGVSSLKRFLLLVLTWFLPILGGISAVLILVMPTKKAIKI